MKNHFKNAEQISVRQLKRRGVKVYGRDVHVSSESMVEKGVKLYSPCYITGRTTIEEGAEILPYSYIDGSVIGRNTLVRSSCISESVVGANCTVGPYAYLRGGAKISDNCRIGDFVEIKNSRLGEGCKAAHLAYIGDATLGSRVNVGCGAVFANYDGKVKSRSEVGDDCFIGCNVNIVAPVRIESGAYIAAGTTVCGDVAAKSLVVGRSRERHIENGAEGRYLNG